MEPQLGKHSRNVVDKVQNWDHKTNWKKENLIVFITNENEQKYIFDTNMVSACSSNWVMWLIM